ncbi:MAG: hypothetical protein P1U57_04670 [Oleibacter sp.]|nr:hypothetical protein [Thalassolituus sp.]
MKYIFLLFAAISLLVNAEDDVVQLQGMTIEGNSEFPLVFFINAWQPPEGTGRLLEPISSFNKHWLTPISRNSLQREMRYSKRYVEKEDHITTLKEVLEID